MMLLLAASILHGTPEITADQLLDHVVAQLPNRHITATGQMFVRQRRGIPIETYRFQLEAKWQQNKTKVSYIIQEENGTPIESLTFQPGNTNIFVFRRGADLTPAPTPNLTENIAKTDVSWMDLTLFFLWWRGAEYVGEETVKNIHCYMIEVPAPSNTPNTLYASARLWISSEQGMLLQAEGLDEARQPVRKLWVQSLKQVEDQWMIQTLEIQHHNRTQRTRLQIDDIHLVPDKDS
jgi:hypothetical protein